VSRSTVTDAIQRLECAGEIEVERRAGRSNLYRITLQGVGQNPAGSPGQNPAQGRRGARPTPGQTGSRDPSGNSSSIREDEARMQEARDREMAENAERIARLDGFIKPDLAPDFFDEMRGRTREDSEWNGAPDVTDEQPKASTNA
jgi:hypothetical protein